MPPPNAMRQKWRILTLRGSANEFICHFCAQANSARTFRGRTEWSHCRLMRQRWRLRFGESPLGERTHRHAQLHDLKWIRFAAKSLAKSQDAVQIARAAYWRVLISETLESFRVKNAVVSVHIT